MNSLRIGSWRIAAALLIAVAMVQFGLFSVANGAVFGPKTFTLPNGLQVVVISNKRAPIVIQMVWYKVGAADEPRGKSGIAHFLEHLMFKGTKTIPSGEFSKIVARNGGQDNAFTSHDYTAYFQRVAKDKLELVMRMEADRMSNLILTEDQVVPERKVVHEERRSRTDNNPGAQLYEQSRAALYLNHPYGQPVIGWAPELSRLGRDDAIAFYRRHYAPNNAILVIAGDVTLETVKRLARKYYGPIPRRKVPPRVRPAEPKQLAARRVQLKSPRVRQPSWSRTFVIPSFRNGREKQGYALQVIAEILGGGATSRLYRTLVVEKKIAVSAGSWYMSDRLDLGEFSISGSPRPGVEMAAFEAAILAELKRVRENGVTVDEFALARNSMLSAAIYARDSLRTGPNVIGRALASGRTIAEVESWPDRIRAVTLEDVNQAVRTHLHDEAAVTSILLPDSTS